MGVRKNIKFKGTIYTPDKTLFRWIDMVDLRGKPPYLPQNMSYTDVLKFAIEKGCSHNVHNHENFYNSFYSGS